MVKNTEGYGNDRPRPEPSARETDRGQAYTLEGLTGALLVLMGVLFALQSVVLTPTTSGTVDQDVKAQLRVEANDLLVTAAQDGTLRSMALNWNNSTATFAYAYRTVGYGVYPPCNTDFAPSDLDHPCQEFGDTLNDTVTSEGYVYNLLVDFRLRDDPRETRTIPLVYRGVPSANAVTATQTVVLYDDMTLTSPQNASGRQLSALNQSARGADFYALDADSGPVYNVLEVRLVVW